MEARGPERLVRVDVSDTGDEGLVEQERLQAALSCPEQPPDGGYRQRVGERLGTNLGERVDRRRAHRLDAVQADPPELPDVPKADFAAVLEGKDEPNVWIL